MRATEGPGVTPAQFTWTPGRTDLPLAEMVGEEVGDPGRGSDNQEF